MRTLVLGLGNELLSDDAAGILAVRALREEMAGRADVVESSMAGMALLDVFLGYDAAVIVDAVCTGSKPVGTISELMPENLGRVLAPSPHYAGLPEMLALVDKLELDFPKKLTIFAVEVADPYTLGGDLTEEVAQALGELRSRVRVQVERWAQEEADIA
ncbi:MAG: hydrogenase maturation protease [Actinomycetota bacterium]